MSNNQYSDIIDLPRPVSTRHKPMDRLSRAAQFSSFAALSGYEGIIREEERLTAARPELGEEEREELNQKLSILLECQASHPAVTVSSFRPDKKKTGGEVVTLSGTLRDVNEAEGVLTFTTGEAIPLSDILNVESDLFISMGISASGT